jgi:hypothetical protein
LHKSAEGQFSVDGVEVDAVSLLELLMGMNGASWTTPDTLRPTPVKAPTNGHKPFDEVIALLCQAAGWKWSRMEDGKYLIQVTGSR